jgi:hypothetical protein
LELLFPLNKPFHRWGAQPFAAVLFMLAVALESLSELRRCRALPKPAPPEPLRCDVAA